MLIDFLQDLKLDKQTENENFDVLSAIEKYKAQEVILDDLKSDYDKARELIKKKMIEVGENKIEGKNGFSYVLSERTSKIVNTDLALNDIKNAGLNEDFFWQFNDKKFIATFEKSDAITSKVTDKVLTIRSLNK